MSFEKIDQYKPNAQKLNAITDLPLAGDVLAQVKADGEFTLAHYERQGETYMVNSWGTKRTVLPALAELKATLDARQLSSCKLLCEAYAVEGERMLMLPKLLHILKGDGDKRKVRLGIWDIADGSASYRCRLQEAEAWVHGCERVHVLPYIQPKTHDEVQVFWDEWVVGRGFEGLMVRAEYNDFLMKRGGFTVHRRQQIFKVKPNDTVDAVIVGINKRPEFTNESVTSLKLALMDADGCFVEMSDVASGISKPLRKTLWKLMDMQVAEDARTVWVQPFVIVKVEYTHTFVKKNMMKFTVTTDGVREVGRVTGHTLRHPILKGFRPDKHVNPTDLRRSQLT